MDAKDENYKASKGVSTDSKVTVTGIISKKLERQQVLIKWLRFSVLGHLGK